MVLLIHACSDRDPATYDLFGRNSKNLRPLLQSEPWIKQAQMALRQPIRFKASDGLELDGSTNGAKSHPRVLMPHGGPIGIADSWADDNDAKLLTSLG